MRLTINTILIAAAMLASGCKSTPAPTVGGSIVHRTTIERYTATTRPTLVERETRETVIQQSESPSAPATLALEGVKASVGPSDVPRAASPTEIALGGLVWLWAGMIVFGVASLIFRAYLPIWPAWAGPMLIVAGVGMLVVSSFIDRAPWWATGAVILSAIAAGFIVSVLDNRRKLAAAQPGGPW